MAGLDVRLALEVRRRSRWRFRVAAQASASLRRSSVPRLRRWRMPFASVAVGRLAASVATGSAAGLGLRGGRR